MAITKDGESWKLDIQPGGRGRKRIRKWFKTKREAMACEIELRNKAQNDPQWKPSKRDSRTLWDLVKLWQQLHGVNLRGNQLEMLQQMVIALGNPRAQSLTPDLVAQYRQQRLDAGNAPKTVNLEVGYLKAVFSELIRLQRWPLPNPLENLRPLKIPPRELTFLSIEEITRLLAVTDASKSDSLPVVARICLATGARWGEAQHLRAEQVRDDRLDLVATKTGTVRTVPISCHLVAMIRAAGRSRGPLFRDCRSAFERALHKAQITLPRGQRSHVLRHSFASHFMMNGGNILVLQRILGHTDLRTTMRYAHMAPDHLQEALKLNPLAALTHG
ncbi:phage integrase [Magnetofaba australis]|uniref:Putative integrase family protein n=1 Tax=Magnetofaba australis IT-1 TaxID=1434232 RepID=A0A1Y2K945_9PROT|nr:tyrosine-type recombinase/integrase [Magnetofaba australis]OSM07017.1 putative integrase family protein [Magnetofaba australis IT-1]